MQAAVGVALADFVRLDGACLEGAGSGFCTTGTLLTTTREPLGSGPLGPFMEAAGREGGGGLALAVLGTILCV